MRVFVTQEIDPAGVTLLEQAGHEVEVRAGEAPIDPAQLRARLPGFDALVSMPTDRIDEALLATPGLRIVAQHAVGYDNIDLSAARRLGVVVTNTPGVLTAATADLTMALLLACARRVVEGDRIVRGGGFEGWRPTMLRGMDLQGARLGIVGFGRIGRAVAERAWPFGLEIVHHSRSSGLALQELLSTSDIVSLHCPLTPQTHHLINDAALASMKPTALLLNTARGPIVDEAALARALTTGRLAAAGLDVYEHEPKVHPDLLALPQVVLLPHLGSATHATRRAMAAKAAQNVIAFAKGKAPPDRLS